MRILNFPKTPPANQYKKLIDQILILSKSLQYIPLEQNQKQNIFHTQFLRSSLFSARIEGNQLTLTQATQINLSDPKEKSNKEISNVLKALTLIKTFDKKFTKQHLLDIHQIVMDGLDDKNGKFRHESSAIFDGQGNVVYLTPDPKEMNAMLDTLIEQINLDQKENISSKLINTVNCHYYFEKIHPFIDGNGRTGRVLMQYMFDQLGLFDKYTLPIEEYFDTKKSEYYFHLEKNTTNTEKFIKFFLEGIIWSLEKILEDIKNLATSNQQPVTKSSIPNLPAGRQGTQPSIQNLLPRRKEILAIIKDHPYINLENISRRFPTTPKRTISYDINQLVKKKLVNKHGQTRGVMYTAIEI